MKVNFLSIFFALSIFSLSMKSQSVKSKYYFVTSKDTVFCKELKFTMTNQGFLKTLQYKDMDDKIINFDGKKKIPNVRTFFINDTIIDRIPQNPNKPEKYVYYVQRVVDGKLKVYLLKSESKTSMTMNYSTNYSQSAQRGAASNPANGVVGNFGMTEVSGRYMFQIKLADGKYYKIKRRTIKKIIKPFLLKCQAFKENYTGDFSYNEDKFIEMIMLYNSICKE